MNIIGNAQCVENESACYKVNVPWCFLGKNESACYKVPVPWVLLRRIIVPIIHSRQSL